MSPEIQTQQAEIETLCRRFGVRKLELFGSIVAGADRADSDMDFLVQFEGHSAMGYADQYFGLLEALEELFGRPVDLVVSTAIKNPYFRESVDKNKALLYAA